MLPNLAINGQATRESTKDGIQTIAQLENLKLLGEIVDVAVRMIMKSGMASCLHKLFNKSQTLTTIALTNGQE